MEDSTDTAAAMAAPAVLPPWPHAAAATETRSRFQGQGTIHFRSKPRDRPCFVRLHGDLILTQGSRGIGPRGGVVCVTDQVLRALDQRHWFSDPSIFKFVERCSGLVHLMLTEALAISEYGNWMDSLRTPALNIAMGILRYVREMDKTSGDLGYDMDIQMPQLHVSLVHKDAAAEAAGVTARGRKRKRRRREPRELCGVCLLDLEIQDGFFLGLENEGKETAGRLPCSHAFHSRCIMPWFHKATTCPTCRHDIMECFSFETWVSSDVSKQMTYPKMNSSKMK